MVDAALGWCISYSWTWSGRVEHLGVWVRSARFKKKRGLIGGRHHLTFGIFQIFCTSKILKFSLFTHKLWHFCQKLRIDDVLLIYVFWTNFQFLCNYLLKHKRTPVLLWKLYPEFSKFHRVIFRVIFLTILPEPKTILQKCHFHLSVPPISHYHFLVFVTFALSKSCVSHLSNLFWVEVSNTAYY